MNILLTFGCSHTVGAEITSLGVGYHKKNNESCYGELLHTEIQKLS